jgi:hypothetical protein
MENCREENRTIFDGVPPKGGVITAAIIADIIADGLNSAEIAAIGGFITIIGDSLGFISAQMSLNEEIAEKNKE